MDLSKFNDADYAAMKTGNIQGMSDQGYTEYKNQTQQYQQALQQSKNPPLSPDAADKASRPDQQYMSPGETATNNYWTNVKARISDPERYKAIAGMQSPAAPQGANKPIGDDLGAAGLTIPMESAPAGLQALASYLTKGGVLPSMTRIAANTAIGGIQGGAQGAYAGGLLGAGGEVLGAAIGATKNLWQTGKMAANPAATQDKAISAISDATDRLRSSESENLAEQLGGKTLKIDTTQIKGVHPEIDELLRANASKVSPYGDIPSELEVPAIEANKIRSLLDQEMTYKKLGPFSQTAETAARDAAIKAPADQLRAQIHGISPQVSDTLDQWSESLNEARNLDKRASNAPMSTLSSPSFDRRALLQKVDTQAGTDLEGLGKQISNAKDLSNAFHNGVHPIDAVSSLVKSAGQGVFKGGADAAELGSTGQGLFDVFYKSKKNLEGQ